jgi:hypothetical protein
LEQEGDKLFFKFIFLIHQEGKMNTKDLPSVIILFVFVGMITAVGLIVLVNIGDSARDTITVSAENHSFLTSGTALTNTQVKEITSLSNTANGTLTENTDWNATIGTTTTTVYVDPSYNNTQFNASYSYYSDTTATTAMDNAISGVTPITTTWISLIVTILALAIILGMVIKSFGANRY